MRLIDCDDMKRRHGMGEECSSCVMDTKACQYDRDYSKMDFCEWLDDAPTIDAVPVVHGEWIRQGAYFWRCSVCDTVTDYNGHYCPNCGARMDGERKEKFNE